MKKRWLMWLLIPAVVAFAVWLWMPDQPITVDSVTLEPRRVEQTVSCMGVVETADSTPVALPLACVIREVKVKVGDRVAEGDVLAVVDKETTRQRLSDATSLMALAAMEEEIVAPNAGTVLDVRAVQGRVLEMGSPCAVLALDEDTQIRIAIRERDLRALKKGMAVRISGDGFDKAAYAGVLSHISSAAISDAAGSTVVEGVVTLSDKEFDPSLRLGLTAKATIVTSVTENGLIIPYESVKTDSAGSYVYVIEDGQAQRRDIQVAAQVAEGMLLKDTNLMQERVICDAECIRDSGQRVTVQGEAS